MTTTNVTIFPNIFFFKNDVLTSHRDSVLAGVSKSKAPPAADSPESLSDELLMLSSNLVVKLNTSITRSRHHEKANSRKLSSSINNVLQNLEYPASRNITLLSLQGVRSNKGSALKALKEWDEYVHSTKTFSDMAEKSRVAAYVGNVTDFNGSARILVGIFSHNLDSVEKKHRTIIRETYLRAYQESQTMHRICSLTDLLDGSIHEDECQLAYTFVIGGNQSAPTMRLNAKTVDEMLVRTNNHDERDAVYLNIRENGKEGKSETWFKYTSMLQASLYFDYVGKIDTDTLLFPEKFLRQLSSWPRFPNHFRTWGGEDEIKADGLDSPVVGPAYMAGKFYWMSSDLARYVGNSCTKRYPGVYSEDITMGNCLNEAPFWIRRIRVHGKTMVHPLKDPEEYQNHWEQHLKVLKLKNSGIVGTTNRDAFSLANIYGWRIV